MIIKDMPKLHSPFVRKEINGQYVVTPEIEPGYEWVFEDPEVRAIEKLDGTNVSIIIENGKITRVFNRTTEIEPWISKSPIVECIREAIRRKYTLFTDGQYFGEAVGDKIQGNPLNLPRMWLPFERMYNTYYYKKWAELPKTFEAISEWLKNDIFSLVHRNYGKNKEEYMKLEGVVFTHPDGRMAKLRRDMFDWYEGKNRHKMRKK